MRHNGNTYGGGRWVSEGPDDGSDIYDTHSSENTSSSSSTQAQPSQRSTSRGRSGTRRGGSRVTLSAKDRRLKKRSAKNRRYAKSLFGEYIPSNQGTVHDIYGNVQSSAVDGRSPYVTSNYGTVDTLRLQDGQRVRVSAVDGDSPYIVARSNGDVERTEYDVAQDDIRKGQYVELSDEISFLRYLTYGSIALNVGLIAYCAMKK